MTYLKSGIPLTDFRDEQRLLFITNLLESVGVQTLIFEKDYIYTQNNQVLDVKKVDELLRKQLEELTCKLVNDENLVESLSIIGKCIDNRSCIELSTSLNIHPFNN